MNIIMIASAFSPFHGSELGVGYGFLKAIKKDNHIHLVTQHFWKNWVEQDSVDNPDFYENISVHYVTMGRLNTIFKENNYQPFNHFLWLFAARGKVKELLSCNEIDIVHYLNLSLLWVYPLVNFKNLPFVWGPVGGGERTPLPLMGYVSNYYKSRENMRSVLISMFKLFYYVLNLTNVKIADKIMCRSKETFEILGHSDAVILSETAVDASQIDASYMRILGVNNDLKICIVGNITERKNVVFALHVFKDLLKIRPGSELHILGEGPQHILVEQLVQSMGLKDNVSMHGSLPRNEVLQFYRKTDLCLHLSLREGGSWTVFESILAGTPVCGYKLNGLRNILNENNSIPLDKNDVLPFNIAKKINDYFSIARRSDDIAATLKSNTWDETGKIVLQAYRDSIIKFNNRVEHR